MRLGIRASLGVTLSVLSFLLPCATTASSQALSDNTDEEIALQLNGAEAPVLPVTVRRESDGRVTTRAVRLDAPLRIDGQLDEPLYDRVQPMSNFIQNEPVNDTAASERTDVWVSFDDEYVYVSVRAFESQPDQMVVNEMRRDSDTLLQNENFAFMFDTFFDRRSSVVFQFNPIGGRMDGQVAREGNYNGDWNPVWELTTGQFDGGWTAEAAIPFKSISYGTADAQLWGFNARRINRWKNEVSYLTRLPTGTGADGINFASFSAPMVGLEAPTDARTLDVKPYVIADVTSDVPSGVSNDVSGDVGLDVRYSLTRNLSAEFTYNTDFAQVEADEQQVNLTRFNLSFPEKREFFLENAGLFDFAVSSGNAGTTAPTLFYSRRIGLENGREIPILAGGRVTGRTGPFNVGVMTIRTEADGDAGVPASTFAVARVRRDILRRSAIGAIFTGRSDTTARQGSAQTYGVDANLLFFENLEFLAYWARTQTPGLDGDDTSYRARASYDADRFAFRLDQIGIGRNFDPAVGFVRREDLQRTWTQARYSPRPAGLAAIRQFQFQGQFEYVENIAGQVENREFEFQFQAQFESSDQLQLQYIDGYEFLPRDFEISDGIIVPTGEYRNDTMHVTLTLGQQRPVSGELLLERGPFYAGTRTSFSYTSARVELHPQLSVEPGIEVNRIDLPVGAFTSQLYSSRVTYTATPLLFVSGLVQYSSDAHQVSTNVRLRWEYQPGSELFIVYNEGRNTLGDGPVDLENRALIVKFNRLFRF